MSKNENKEIFYESMGKIVDEQYLVDHGLIVDKQYLIDQGVIVELTEEEANRLNGIIVTKGKK